MKQRAEITFEIEETVVMRREPSLLKAFCGGCMAPALMASPPAAALFSGISEREIFRLVEAGQIHFSEDGRVLICLNSLKHLRDGVEL